MLTRNKDGFTAIEVVILIGIVLILLVSVGPGIAGYLSRTNRMSTRWTDGRFQNPPTYVDVSPGTGTFMFIMREGTGVDESGAPTDLNRGTLLRNRAVTVELTRPTSPVNGTLVSLNGVGVSPGTLTASATTDHNGVVTIVVEVDSYESFVLAVTDDATGLRESLVFVGN